jgi:hypothetical protein
MADDLEDDRVESPNPNPTDPDAVRAAADAEDDPDRDSQTIEHDGKRYVRVEALKEARTKVKTLRDTNKTLKADADRYALVKPYLGLLATHPDVVRRTGGTVDDPNPKPPAREPAAPVAPVEVDEFDDVITSLGIDAKAGRKLATLVTHIADKRSARAAAPIAEAANRSTAQSALSRALAATDNEGNPYATPEAIEEVFRNIPGHMLGDDKVIQTALIQARGLGGPGKRSDPVHVESAGGARRGNHKTEALTPLERTLIGKHGMSEDEFRELSRQDTLELE